MSPLRVQFMVTLWRRVMTPFQAARISVTAYPIIQVDMLAVVKCALIVRTTATHHTTRAAALVGALQ